MEENKENVVEETTPQEQPKVDEEVGKIKVKKPKKKKSNKEVVTKVNLSKPEQELTKVEVKEEIKEEPQEIVEEQTPIVEEVTDIEPVVQEEVVTPKYPEALQKVVNFMEETGGDLNDYMLLNQDYDKLDESELLNEYYKNTKPHLNQEEISFLVQDNFNWDESYDNEKDVKRKKLALKEQVAEAKQHLESVKSKYYEDLKMGSKLTEEQSEAIKSYNKYKEESIALNQAREKATKTFLQKTSQVFNDEFKGFEYKVGDRRFRYNVGDVDSIKNTQSDINNFVKKFLNENNEMENAAGYHKGLFTAMNADAIANHFYEQGRADALQNSIAKSKNINMDPRQTHAAPKSSGMTARVLNTDDSPVFKFKKRK